MEEKIIIGYIMENTKRYIVEGTQKTLNIELIRFGPE
jgi:hypothetical protein